MDINHRFVYGPSSPYPFPYDTGYPAYTYPKEDDPRVIRMIHSYYRSRPLQKMESNSLKSVVSHMLPYTFRHYRTPTYRELWEYNNVDPTLYGRIPYMYR